MKKVLSLLFIAISMSFVACGPNAEEKARMEAEAKFKMDSLFEAASKSIIISSDSVTRAQDSIAMNRTKRPKGPKISGDQEKH